MWKYLYARLSHSVCLSGNIIMVGNSRCQPGMEGRICTPKDGGGRVVGMGGVQKQMNEAEIAIILFLQ